MEEVSMLLSPVSHLLFAPTPCCVVKEEGQSAASFHISVSSRLRTPVTRCAGNTEFVGLAQRHCWIPGLHPTTITSCLLQNTWCVLVCFEREKPECKARAGNNTVGQDVEGVSRPRWGRKKPHTTSSMMPQSRSGSAFDAPLPQKPLPLESGAQNKRCGEQGWCGREEEKPVEKNSSR